MGDNIDS